MTETSAPAEVVPVWAIPADPVDDLAIRLAARAMAREDEDGEWTWRDIAQAALEKPLAADGGQAERICRDAAEWELSQAGERGIGKKAADNHRSAAHALELAADKIAGLSSGKTVGAGEGEGTL